MRSVRFFSRVVVVVFALWGMPRSGSGAPCVTNGARRSDCPTRADVPMRTRPRAAPSRRSQPAPQGRDRTVIDHGPVLVPVPRIHVPVTSLPLLTLDSFSTWLADRDWVNVVILDGRLRPNQISIRLRTTPGMWFKGIRIHGTSRKLESQGDRTVGPLVLTESELASATLIFSKAKELGVPRDVYELPGYRLRPLLGRRIAFDWMRD
jgi:hypothetical protein